jgi:hypothetical protein
MFGNYPRYNKQEQNSHLRCFKLFHIDFLIRSSLFIIFLSSFLLWLYAYFVRGAISLSEFIFMTLFMLMYDFHFILMYLIWSTMTCPKYLNSERPACRMNAWWMIIWKGFGRKRSYSPDICLEGMSKTTENINQDSQCPGRDSNWPPPKYEPRPLPLLQPVKCGDMLPSHFSPGDESGATGARPKSRGSW